jgi:hypothetical protein
VGISYTVNSTQTELCLITEQYAILKHRRDSDNPADEPAYVSSGKDIDHHLAWFVIPAM